MPHFNLMHRPRWARLAALLLCAAALPSTAAADPDAEALAAVGALAQLNGQALACRALPAAQQAKALMLAHAPKTPRHASVYEDGTQASYLAQLAEPGRCPAAAELASALVAAGQRLQRATAGAQHAPAAGPDTPPAEAGLLPRYLLQGPGGRAVTSEDFRGRFQLVAFGFVSCPDVCPTTMAEMQQVLQGLGGQAARLQPVFISVDPQRDSPQVLQAYTREFDPRILGLTGPEALLRRAADSFRVVYRRVQEPGARPDVYTLEHTAGMFLLGPDGRLAERFAYGTPAAELVARIARQLAAASP